MPEDSAPAPGFHARIPFVELLGLQMLRIDPGRCEIAAPLRDELMNSLAVAHGGVTMTLLDVAMAHAARSPDAVGGAMQPGVVTIEMKTAFMRPGLGRLVARATRLHRTANLAFCDASVLDEHGRLVAHGSGTFKYLKAQPGTRPARRADVSD